MRFLLFKLGLFLFGEFALSKSQYLYNKQEILHDAVTVRETSLPRQQVTSYTNVMVHVAEKKIHYMAISATNLTHYPVGWWRHKRVSRTYQDAGFDGFLNHPSSLDATIMVSQNSPIIGEHVVIIFSRNTICCHSNSMTTLNFQKFNVAQNLMNRIS